MTESDLFRFERVERWHEPDAGLHGFMVQHDTRRGPATGGVRLYRYADERAACLDGLRLARAMTYKAAAAELPVGGGKIVLFEPPPERRASCLEAVGRALEALDGRFLAGRDVGVPVADGAVIRRATRFMVDESEDGVGDLNRRTAEGVVAGARAALSHRLGRDGFDGATVAIQGAGGVGAWLARLLSDEGADLRVCDVDRRALDRLAEDVRFTEVPPDAIFDAACDVLAPCAVGGVLDEAVAGRVAATIVAGSANNILARPGAADVLARREITYVPEVLINAGALIQGVRFLLHGERDSSGAILEIGERAASLLRRAAAEGLTPKARLEADLSAVIDLQGPLIL